MKGLGTVTANVGVAEPFEPSASVAVTVAAPSDTGVTVATLPAAAAPGG